MPIIFPFWIHEIKMVCLLPDYVEKVEKEDISPVKMVDSGDTDCDHLPGSCHLPRHGHETWRKWTVMETLIHVSPISLSSVVSALIFHTFRCLSHNTIFFLLYLVDIPWLVVSVKQKSIFDSSREVNPPKIQSFLSSISAIICIYSSLRALFPFCVMCHRYLYLQRCSCPWLAGGARCCQARPVSQLFPLADRAEHLALPRHKTQGPGLARRSEETRVVLSYILIWYDPTGNTGSLSQIPHDNMARCPDNKGIHSQSYILIFVPIVDLTNLVSYDNSLVGRSRSSSRWLAWNCQ